MVRYMRDRMLCMNLVFSKDDSWSGDYVHYEIRVDGRKLKAKKVRDKRDEWIPFELFVKNHTEADVSHGLCPESCRKLYPTIADEAIARKNKDH